MGEPVENVPLDPTCPRCGVPRTTDARFCGTCGLCFEETPPPFDAVNPVLPAVSPPAVSSDARDTNPASLVARRSRSLPPTEPGLPIPGEPAIPRVASTLPGPAGVLQEPTLHGTDLVAGTIIDGRYRVKDKLGSGGMGTVYRVIHERMQKVMALKILNPSMSSDPVVRQRFKREARAASLLESRNTVAVFDFGETADGLLYLVMEYMRGRTLAQEMARLKRLPPNRAVKILSQVLRSLEEAHTQGIVHRDIKPDNIFLLDGDEPDIVKVLDFGIAKGERLADAERQGPTTRADLVVGTPEYMAPEQARGQSVDGRADLWAVGVILYECLVGQLPFSGPSPVEVLVALMEHPVPPPWDVGLDLDVPLPLWRVVECALQKRPDRRYQNAHQMREALLAAAAEMGSGVNVPTGPSLLPASHNVDSGNFDIAGRDEWESFERSQRRRRNVLVGLLIAFALATGAGVGTVLSFGQPVAAEREPNDDVITANLVVHSSSVRGVLAMPRSGKADQDMFVMELPPGPQVLTAEVAPIPAAPVELGITAWVAPSNSRDGKLVFSGRGKTMAHPRIPNLTVEGGRLYLRVKEEPASSAAPPTPQEISYRLSIYALRPLVPGEERESNNTREAANILGTDAVVTGWISPADDEDWFKVPVPPEDRELSVEVSPAPDLAVDVSFHDANGKRALRKAGKPGERVSLKITSRRCGVPCFVVVEPAARSGVVDPQYRLIMR